MAETKDQAKYSSEASDPSGSSHESFNPNQAISSQDVEQKSQSGNPPADTALPESEQPNDGEQSGMSTTVKILIGVGVLIGGLIVCGIVGFILSVTLLAVNPAANFESTRNTQRSSDISAILNAITQYTSESGNSINTLVAEAGFNGQIAQCSAGLPSTSYTGISVAVAGVDSYIDLDRVLVPDYIGAIPSDPNMNSVDTFEAALYTGYSMCLTQDGRVQVVATETESNMENLYVVR